MKISALLILIAITSLSLTGCSTCKNREVIEVKIPVTQPWPEPPKIKRPMLEINYVTNKDMKNNNYDKIIKSLQISVQQLIQYSEKLEHLLDAYRPAKKN